MSTMTPLVSGTDATAMRYVLHSSLVMCSYCIGPSHVLLWHMRTAMCCHLPQACLHHAPEMCSLHMTTELGV